MGRLSVHVKICTAFPGPRLEYFSVETAAGLRLDLVPTAIQVHRALGAHDLDHGLVALVHERALEMDLELSVGVAQQSLDRVGGLPAIHRDSFPDRGGQCRIGQVKQPIDSIDPMHHQVSEDAPAEVPEPTPVSEAIAIEGL